jgi:plastocyanin domain-containing protein
VSVADILVALGGTGLVAGELWYFLGPRPRPGNAPVTPAADGVQEVRIVVQDGYDPDTVFVEAGRPVRLLFYRDETVECSARVVFSSLGIDRELLPFQTTAVEFTPEAPGDYPFRCHMDMLHGRVVAQLGREGARAKLGKGHGKHG